MKLNAPNLFNYLEMPIIKPPPVVKLDKKHNFDYSDITRVALFLDESQLENRRVKGVRLQEKWQKLSCLGANAVDFLLANPSSIPGSWKEDAKGRKLFIHFPGTIYTDNEGDDFIRYIYWGCQQWNEYVKYLDGDWDAQNPVAILK